MTEKREQKILLRLKDLEIEKKKLTQELENLRKSSNLNDTASQMTPDDKIKLFRSFFKGREDVYARRWENFKTNKFGYFPAKKDKEILLPITDEVIKNHLQGQDPKEPLFYGKRQEFVVGIYPLLLDETCCFLAVDFDKSSWHKDVRFFMQTCKELEVPAYIEKSRSGNGAHIWIFFEEPISAAEARRLGSFLLTLTMEKHPEIGFSSYDRLFPNQDTMPKGGFGNLIALPLQYKARQDNNSVFVDEKFNPYPDQWQFLSNVKRMNKWQVGKILEKYVDLSLNTSFTDEDQDKPWAIPAKVKEDFKDIVLPSTIRIVISNQIYIPKENLPPKLMNKILKLAAFQNPEFYKAQAMRFSTYDKPRIISCAEILTKYITLPRGCLKDLKEFLNSLNITLEIQDERESGMKIKISFMGKLRKDQKEAVNKILEQDIGILSAPTAFGKTVIAANVIASRKVNTLILVHRKQLADQWIEKFKMFLNTEKVQIGQIGSGKFKPSGQIDVAIIQSLIKKENLDEILAQYGQLIVDECHHLAAFSFEQVSKKFRGKYVLGMSATVERKDGHQPIIIMQCGQIVHNVNPKLQNKQLPFNHFILPKYTDFRMLEEQQELTINQIYASLIQDKDRNKLIFDDISTALQEKRACVVLTERKEHIDCFVEHFKNVTENLIILTGGIGNKARKQAILRLKEIPENEELLIIATGKYLGEGFDEARLNTLFLTMPISWKGTLAQYAGRLHRVHHSKKEVIIYDYVDSQVTMLARMYDRRLKGYKLLGYELKQN
ncbi:MAG: hypothetical protein A2287_10105 [Candidatus Melainabacteria bacterium RIFOXYA12_FULL_32_12]|nr:MAG: hypothetical protein A2287_10105 [Candidatus Melainabacteria bacterium RIFOXYA12_FULL_32_12]